MSALAIHGETPAVTTPEGAYTALKPAAVSRLMSRIGTMITEGDHRGDAMRGLGVIGEFEEALAVRGGAEYAISTSSGTAALIAALLVSGVRAGDEVIVSTYGWGGTVGAVLAIGAVPRFTDIEARTYNIDPNAVARNLTERTRAILATHLFGHPADVSGLQEIAAKAGIPLIFDAAQALGATWLGRPIGAWGDLVALSFGRGKLVGTFEGGAVLTRDPALYEGLVLLTQHPLRALREIEDPRLRRYVDETGLSCRMHPVAAAIGLEELEAFDDRLRRRRDSCRALATALEGIQGVRPPVEVAPATHSFHQFALAWHSDDAGGLSRESAIRILQSEGVPVTAGPVRVPIHLRRRFQTPPSSDPGIASQQTVPVTTAPIAERRCAAEELMIESDSRWLSVPTARIDEIATAFRKLATNSRRPNE